jgi:hypothetical protein
MSISALALMGCSFIDLDLARCQKGFRTIGLARTRRPLGGAIESPR